MAEAYAWVRIATAKQLQQLGMDETKINGISTMNIFEPPCGELLAGSR